MKIKNVLEKKEMNIMSNDEDILPDKIEFIGKFIEETNILMSCCQIDLEVPYSTQLDDRGPFEYDNDKLKNNKKQSKSKKSKIIKPRKKIKSSKKIDKNTCYRSILNKINKHKYGAISSSACNGIG